MTRQASFTAFDHIHPLETQPEEADVEIAEQRRPSDGCP